MPLPRRPARPRSAAAGPLGRALLLALAAAGCTQVYYEGMDQLLGKQKRHILRDRVEAGREEQREAQEEFQSTYERFAAVSGFRGGDLEATWRELDAAYERSEARADAVRRRIESIEQVAADLFEEWQQEIGLISSPALRRSSEQQLRDTRARYGELIAAMRRSEAKMDPVLVAFRDQVLYLKHNLNARAIAALETTVVEIRDDVADLIAEMQRSIDQAESFLRTLEG